jgi:hypothetical protein
MTNASVPTPPVRPSPQTTRGDCDASRTFRAGFTEVLVSIDGGPSTNILLDRYLAVSPQTTVDIPEGNILNVSAQTTMFVAAGWVAMIRPLRPGTHTIQVAVLSTDGTRFVTEAIIEVAPGQP